MQDGSRRVIVMAMLANLGIAIAKLVGYVVTASASMLAEAVHSFADTGNQALLVWGGVQAKREPSAQHPFGYGRERYFWAFVVAMVLFTLGALFSLHEGFAKLRQPHDVTSPGWAIGILVLAVVLEGVALRAAMREGNRTRGRESWWGFIRRSKSPELPVVLLEDAGAVLGLMMALVGVGLTIVTGDARYDALGSMGIGVLLGVIAIVLAVEMKSLLIGEGARASEVRAIRSVIEGDSRVRRIVDLKTLHLGPDHLLVAGKVEMDAGLGFGEIVARLNAIEKKVKERVVGVQVMYLEPEIGDGRVDTGDPSP
jgi:cation diffusion facilitator family transporter